MIQATDLETKKFKTKRKIACGLPTNFGFLNKFIQDSGSHQKIRTTLLGSNYLNENRTMSNTHMSASFCLDFSVTLFITESSKFNLSEKHIRRNKKKPQTPRSFLCLELPLQFCHQPICHNTILKHKQSSLQQAQKLSYIPELTQLSPPCTFQSGYYKVKTQMSETVPQTWRYNAIQK